MEPGLASTIHRTVDRAQGLGQVVHSTLLQIVSDTYPQLFVKAKTDPWLDDLQVPGDGDVAFFLVGGKKFGLTFGLGEDSEGNPRRNTYRCL